MEFVAPMLTVCIALPLSGSFGDISWFVCFVLIGPLTVMMFLSIICFMFSWEANPLVSHSRQATRFLGLMQPPAWKVFENLRDSLGKLPKCIMQYALAQKIKA